MTLTRDALERIRHRIGYTAPDGEDVQLGYNPWVPFNRLIKTVQSDLEVGKCGSKGMQLQIGIMNNTGVNAFATHSEGVDIIGMNIGFFHKATALPEAILSHHSIFPNVGSIEGLVEFVADEDWIKAGVDHLGRRPAVLTDHARAKLAAQIMQTVILIIFRHEFAHIWNGHVDWIRNYKSILSYEEIGHGQSVLTGLDALTFEWDADKDAVPNSLAIILGAKKRRTEDGYIKWQVPETNLIGTVEEAITVYVVALHLCFQIFERPTFSGIEDLIARGSHPPAIQRLNTALNVLGSILSTRTDIPFERWRIAVKDGIDYATRGLALVTNTDPVNPVADNVRVAANELKDRLRLNWKDKLYDELMPLKRGPRLPDKEQPAPYTNFDLSDDASNKPRDTSQSV